MQPVVRPAEGSDIAAIVALYLEVAEEVIDREPTFRRVPEMEAVQRRYADRLTERRRTVLVAIVDDVVAGFADAVLDEHESRATYHAPGIDAYVEELIVTERYRRRGVGATLIGAVEAWAHSAGARLVTLDTHVTNDAARGLYASMGYREVGVILAKEL